MATLATLDSNVLYESAQCSVLSDGSSGESEDVRTAIKAVRRWGSALPICQGCQGCQVPSRA